MQIYDYFGEAVHEALPFLKNGGDPSTLTPSTLQQRLERIDCLKPFTNPTYKITFNRNFVKRVHTAWMRIKDVSRGAVRVDYEPTDISSRIPDMVVYWPTETWMVEIKARTTKNGAPRYKSLQVRELMSDFRDRFESMGPRAFILHFDNRMEKAFNSQLIELPL